MDGVRIIDDYAHHPVEIASVLTAARAVVGEGKVIAVVQPHRFTRLRDHMDDFAAAFNDADVVYAAPVYAGLLLAVPFAMLTSSPAFGRLMIRIGLCRIPEEIAVPAEIAPMGLPAVALAAGRA